MASLIEKAAQRLEQLRQAGADVPDMPEAVPASAAGAARAPVATPRPPAQPQRPQSNSRVVQLDLDALTEAGFVTPKAQRSLTAEQFRVIKRPLLTNAMGKGAAPVTHGNRIMVTSAMAGEGKTFTAINLAMSMAMELDHTVLLVDADVSRPSIMKTLGLPSGPGLLDLLLANQTEMSDALLRTNIDKLTLLPSGTPHPRATELLASDAMSALVEEMGRRYPERIIIFDSPPLLMTTESRVLATHMGQIVMVVQAGQTQRAQVRHALETIENCPIKLMVLNQVREEERNSYGYGYGYGAEPAAAAADTTT
ncbi:MAG: polysaccharide biosynthesis tyrosine autokinase [Hydrogenophaga sp.]|uniref:XrtA-associated tyrosine autokinase n=1 Tax=Hydrogenophaga sp. TaxID=1904254 RepID=UPI0016AA1F8B|nr:XrtA-associated tyrosine autokinase [Hydrogenophaga sp.]NIM41223.1 polysaccharide biosynthesis tyrosine autokinase [Hydrogenophaga sp.]NIN26539.1 polysaccharide biosynthesis tyrosine autokinase [Hydrogenophaga sp.]NIN31414.1 polysaccharide biosynthesis tyrosine autokinase [Hydrogenophaga sp.]NIN55469.1 polysaccharide biosynthesis tyrosine autokinase [Hydrogenophaga sp.]NIO51804.1 polysaccharide biosynthesis tyrosine autokinase [Hydrogenophaga sp.]